VADEAAGEVVGLALGGSEASRLASSLRMVSSAQPLCAASAPVQSHWSTKYAPPLA